MRHHRPLLPCLLLAVCLMTGCGAATASQTASPAPAGSAASALPAPSAPAPSATSAIYAYANEPLIFADAKVEEVLCTMLGKQKGEITAMDMAGVTEFSFTEYDVLRKEKNIQSIEDLRHCVNLQKLSLSKQPITSIEALRDLQQLKTVMLAGCTIADVSPLAGKETLQDVNLSNTGVTDASPVLALPNLREFTSSDTMEDISALRGTAGLVSFRSYGKLKDITPLLQHRELETVLFSNLSNDDIAAVFGHCKKLKKVLVMKSDMKDSSLALLSDGVTALALYDCPAIEDISALSRLTNLQSLFLGKNNIRDIAPLAKLTNLAELTITANKVQDIAPLAGLGKVKFLTLTSNQITDLRPLLQMKALMRLSVALNPYTDSSVLDELKERGCELEK